MPLEKLTKSYERHVWLFNWNPLLIVFLWERLEQMREEPSKPMFHGKFWKSTLSANPCRKQQQRRHPLWRVSIEWWNLIYSIRYRCLCFQPASSVACKAKLWFRMDTGGMFGEHVVTWGNCWTSQKQSVTAFQLASAVNHLMTMWNDKKSLQIEQSRWGEFECRGFECLRVICNVLDVHVYKNHVFEVMIPGN